MPQLNINFAGDTNPFRFTDPIRKYKENDPYHVDVDNIPIKQLEENIQWLKNSLETATVDVDLTNFENLLATTTSGITRENFKELKAFTKVGTGRPNVVFVNPGRFTARINDAYDLTPLQVISRITASSFGEYASWDVAESNNPAIQSILNRLRSTIAASSLSMNGFAERGFVNPYTYNPDFIFNPLEWTPIRGDIGYNGTQLNLNPTDVYPSFFSFLWGTGLADSYPIRRLSFNARVSELSATEEHQSAGGLNHRITQYARDLFYGDTEFVKRWRGIARTAVVDVPEELSAVVPNFDSDDFSYFNEADVKLNPFGNIVSSRIDLLFIYSKPVDQTGTYISDFDLVDPNQTSNYGNSPNNSVPKKILKPELGVLKGAGVQISYKEGSKWFIANPKDTNNRHQIVAQAVDQLNTDLGFKQLNVHGSFPAPDDLLNISPLLAEWLPSKHVALVGQTILPIAYVVVRKDSINNNVQVISNSDIIDIRPFFRTTELAYNERAGIAAAIPSVSLMNPVASESFVKHELKKLKDQLDSLIPTGTGNTGGGGTGGGTSTQLLLKDQYQVTEVDIVTSSILNKLEITNKWSYPFGGRYFALWPSGGGTSLAQTSVLAPSDIATNLQNWASNSTTNPFSDGVYLTDNPFVRFFVFSISSFPAFVGNQGSIGDWSVLISNVKPKSFNLFSQVARNQDGGPLTQLYRNLPPGNGGYTLNNPVLRAEWLYKVGQGTIPYNGLQLMPTYMSPEWISTFPTNVEDGINNAFMWSNSTLPTSFPYVENPTQFADNTIYPGWKVFVDFNPMSQFNVDFKTVAIAYRSSNTPATIVAPTGNATPIGFAYEQLGQTPGTFIRRLFRGSASFTYNRGTDIKIVVAVSNRIQVKDITFTVQNARIS